MDTITPEMRVHGVTPWQKPWGNEMRAIGEARALAVCRRGGVINLAARVDVSPCVLADRSAVELQK